MEKKQVKQSAQKGIQTKVRQETQCKRQEEKVDAESFKLQNKRKTLLCTQLAKGENILLQEAKMDAWRKNWIEIATIWAMSMEGATKQDVAYMLLRLEVKHGERKGIGREAGSYPSQGNINRLVASGENESGERRFLGLIKEYAGPTGVQLRNYSEKSTGLFKKAIKDLPQTKKGRNIPDLVLEIAVDAHNKLGQLDMMMRVPPQYYAVRNHTRSEMSRASGISFEDENIRKGTGKETMGPEIGYLVLVKSSDFTKRGMITEIHGEGAATVHTEDGDTKRGIGRLRPPTGNRLSR